eukprot:CAMPEP_0180557230 /NCGR_PEP_ID=MMETSP1037_2-20121125/1042_1 /TAXON_ID=632150 /ORGANISM="Azadinium spinosum, Strain 3D9" /LENGTH=392 /DNA_ID=CAMNT_0022573401 /DNA_START=48 /DNA_END=1223 /DNA_ORIENTATION=+
MVDAGSKPRVLIDLNTANPEELQRLPGVGVKRAAEIADLREAAGGSLPSLSHLKKLRGVGPKALEKIGRFAYVSPELGLHSDNNGEDCDAELRQRCDQLLVGAWNVRNLGRKALQTDRARDVAKIVAEYDVIALVELRDHEVVEGLVEILGGLYGPLASPPRLGTDHHKEVYAFLYRIASVKLLRSELLADPSDSWVREPFMGHFRASKGFDFILSVVHIVWGDTVSKRRNEVEALCKKMTRIKKWDGERDVLLVGDFNLEPDDKAWDTARTAGWMPLLEGGSVKSMVGDTHLYDNIWVSRLHTAQSEWLGAAGVIHFDTILDFGGVATDSSKNATKELTDHRPTWALFASDIDDDGTRRPAREEGHANEATGDDECHQSGAETDAAKPCCL